MADVTSMLLALNDKQKAALQNSIDTSKATHDRLINELVAEAQDGIAGWSTDAPGGDWYTRVHEELTSLAAQAAQAALDQYDETRGSYELISGKFDDYTPIPVGADRAMWGLAGGTNNTDNPGLTYKQVITGDNRAGIRIDSVWQQKMKDAVGRYRADGDDSELRAIAGDIIRTADRMTMLATAKNDPTRPRYMRVPKGPFTCAFCVMLAGRGYVYWTSDTAGAASRYHKHDDCTIVCNWAETKVGGYDPSYYKDIYDTALKKAGLKHATWQSRGEGKPRKKTSNSEVNEQSALHAIREQMPQYVTDAISKPRSKDDAIDGLRVISRRKDGAISNQTADGTLSDNAYRAARAKALEKTSWADLERIRHGGMKMPPMLPVDPVDWTDGMPATLTAERWNHILYGYDRGGGHMHGYGWIHNGTEFPGGWDEKKILDACKRAVQLPEVMAAINNPEEKSKDVAIDVDGVSLPVRVSWAGNIGERRITSFFPVDPHRKERP